MLKKLLIKRLLVWREDYEWMSRDRRRLSDALYSEQKENRRLRSDLQSANRKVIELRTALNKYKPARNPDGTFKKKSA